MFSAQKNTADVSEYVSMYLTEALVIASREYSEINYKSQRKTGYQFGNVKRSAFCDLCTFCTTVDCPVEEVEKRNADVRKYRSACLS